MRKLFLSLLALVSTVGAWAEPITALDDNVVGKVFTIRSNDRGAFVYSTENEGYVSGSKRVNSGDLNNTDKNFLFAFVQEGSNYFLYSIGAAKYCAYTSEEDAVVLQDGAPAAGVTFLASTGGVKDQFPTVIAIDGSHQLNMSADQKKGILTSWNNTGDAGNMLAIEEVEGCTFDNATKAFTDKRLSFTYRYMYGDRELATQSAAGLVGNAYPALTATLPFGIEASAPEGVMKAEDANTTIDITCTVSDAYPFKYADSYDNIDTWYDVRLHSNQTNYMYWTGEAIAFAGSSQLDDAYAWAFVGNPIDGFKVYNKAAGSGVMLNDSDPCSLSAGDFIVKTYASSKVTIANGGFCLKFDGQTYLNYQGGAVKRWGSADEGSTWRVNEVADVNAVFDALKSAETFDILEGSTVQGPSEFANPETLNEDIAAAQLVGDNADAKKAFIASEAGQRIQNYLNQKARYGALANVQFEMKAEFGTLIMPCPSSPIEGLKRTTLAEGAIDANGVINTDGLAEGDFAFNTPYLIQAEEGSKFTIIGWLKNHENTHTSGLLTGVLAEGEKVPAGSYILSSYNGKLGFYKVAEGADYDAAVNKCYLTLPAAESRFEALYFESGTQTGITGVEGAQTQQGGIYNIAGQRLTKLQKGLNIVNGKKIIVK